MQPETLDRLFRAGVLNDVAEDQLAFPACVACVDYVRNTFVLDEPAEDIDAAAHFFRRLKLKFRRHDGKFFHVPFVLLFHRSRHRKFKEMAYRP